jgi:hypothetical protein
MMIIEFFLPKCGTSIIVDPMIAPSISLMQERMS